MSAAEIAKKLGGHRASSGWWLCQCPAHADASPSLGLRDGDRGLVVKCFAGCPRANVLEKLEDAGNEVAPEPRAEHAQRQRTDIARDIWRTSTVAGEESLVAIYLATRQILLPVPRSLRQHGAFGPYGEHKPSGAHRPQMVGAVQRVGADGVVAVHRTFLQIDGMGKFGIEPVRMMMGPAKGGAVRLAPLGPVLMVAEGIENALSAMEATGLPAWAALSASGVEALVLPPEVREAIILADHDKAGQEAADTAAHRWVKEGRKVGVAMPKATGADFNDVLKGAA
jgi:putative DNA primase/helicase